MLTRQLSLDLWARDRSLVALADECRQRGLLPSDVDLLLVVAREDQTRESLSYGCKSLRAWALAIGHDKKTVARSMERLADKGALELEPTQDGYAVLVDWQAVFALPLIGARRAEIRAALEVRHKGGGDMVGTPGDTGPTCSWKQESKPRVTCRPESVSSRGGRVSSGDSAGTAQMARLPARPWAKVGGLRSEALVQAVRTADETILTGLYWAGVEARFWADCEAYRQRFLACCWQAVESATVSAMGLLGTLCRRNLRDRQDGDRDSTLTNAADDWATETRRAWASRGEYAQARRARRVEYEATV